MAGSVRRRASQPAPAAARRIAPTSRTVSAVCSTLEWYGPGPPEPASCDTTVGSNGPRRPLRQGHACQGVGMLKALRNLILYRLIGGRIMLGLALLGLARRILGRRRSSTTGRSSTYQPSQGESQIVQRDPR